MNVLIASSRSVIAGTSPSTAALAYTRRHAAIQRLVGDQTLLHLDESVCQWAEGLRMWDVEGEEEMVVSVRFFRCHEILVQCKFSRQN